MDAPLSAKAHESGGGNLKAAQEQNPCLLQKTALLTPSAKGLTV
jgi:hypothetical protein